MKDFIAKVKTGDSKSTEELLQLFDSYIRRKSYIDGQFNEDCYQELRIKLLDCVRKFSYDKINNILENLSIDIKDHKD